MTAHISEWHTKFSRLKQLSEAKVPETEQEIADKLADLKKDADMRDGYNASADAEVRDLKAKLAKLRAEGKTAATQKVTVEITMNKSMSDAMAALKPVYALAAVNKVDKVLHDLYVEGRHQTAFSTTKKAHTKLTMTWNVLKSEMAAVKKLVAAVKASANQTDPEWEVKVTD